MLQQKPKGKKVPGWARGIIGLELAIFAGSYILWSRMNNNVGFRYYLSENYPYVLEGFYKSSSLMSGEESIKKIRESDLKIFNDEKSFRSARS